LKQLVRDVKISGTGSHLPETIISNKDLEKNIETSDKWIRHTLGIVERRIADKGQTTSDLAAGAAIKAIKNANLDASEIDLIIVATATPDRKAPSTACIVQDKIMAYNSVAFDIAAVCSGFLFALSVASQFIACGVYDNVLVIGADIFSGITDWTKRDAVFFGDGAGAAVVTHGKAGEGFLSFRLYSDGRGKDGFTVPGGGSEFPLTSANIKDGLQYFSMNGNEVYKTATKVLPQAINQVLEDCGFTIEDIDLFIPHQPSIGILKETASIISLPFEKVMTNMAKYANTSGGTIPILLDEVNRSGMLTKGKNILFAAVGSGWTWGAAIIKWS
jgi:3-oxoacyl-[acyl-carrier-protein] synthase III